MKTLFKYLMIICLLCFLDACSSEKDIEKDTSDQFDKENEPPVLPNDIELPLKTIELTFKQREIVNAGNYFAFNIFKEVSALAKEPNTFFSPLSLNFALGMLINGATGETRMEMAEVLGMADFTDNEINEYYQKMMQSLLIIDPQTDIGIANSIRYKDGFPVKQPFIETNKDYFDAEVSKLNFSIHEASDVINAWCAEKTKDKIQQIVPKPIPDNIVMYLINALYFKSKWMFQFDKENTKADDFIKADNQLIRVNMMEQTATLPYYADQHVQCVEIPYGYDASKSEGSKTYAQSDETEITLSNDAFSMVAILPADNMDIDRLIDYLDDDIWQNIIDNLHWDKVMLKLPRFKIEFEIPLNEPIKNVGMTRIFYGGLDKISDDGLFVSDILQKTFVEVNEEGVEAAAVTGISVITMKPNTPASPVQFYANRPFLYVIKEKSTGAILFIGRMDEPKE